MSRWIGEEQVRRRVPAGCKLPARFDDFLRSGLPVAVEWNDLSDYALKETATKETVPFLRLAKGGLVAFWFGQAPPAVVSIDTRGELRVIARDFDDFLRSLHGRCTGLSEFDEAEPPLRVPGMESDGVPNRESLAALQASLDAWRKKHTVLQEPLRTPDAEELRRRVHRIAETMIADGYSTGDASSSPWWSLTFRIKCDGEGLTVAYLNAGEWYPVPKKYELEREVAELLDLVRHKGRDEYELSTCSAGIVSVDSDRELVLIPLDIRTR